MVEFSGAAKELETLVVRIVADATKLKAGYSDAAKASDDVADELKNVQKSSDETTKAFDKTGDAAQKSSDKLDDMADVADDAGKALEDASDDVDEMKQALKDEGAAAQEAGKQTEKAGEDAEDAGEKMGKGAKNSDELVDSLKDLETWAFAAAAAIAAISAAAVIASDKVKEAMNTIELGTGNTGADLTGVIEEFNAIAGTIPSSMEDISTAVADLNTAYNLQGDELEGLARHYLALADITEGDVSDQIAKARSVFNKLGVTIEDQTDTLDYFYRVSQLSGVKFGELLDILNAGDDGFQMMGLSAKQAAALIGTLIRNDDVEAANELTAGLEMGLNQVSNQMLSASSEAANALKEASDAYDDAIKSKNPEKISEAAQALVEAKEKYEKIASSTSAEAGLEKLRDTLKEMAETGDPYEAQRIGADLFGRYALRVAGAVQSGALAWQDLDDEVSASTKSVQDWEKETRTTGDALGILGTKATLAFAPLGDAISTVLTEKIFPALDELAPYFEEAMPAAIRIVERFGEEFEKGMDRIKPVLDALKPILDLFFQSIGSGSDDSIIALHPLIHTMEIFGTWWDENSEVIIAGCAVIWEKVQELWTQIEPYVTTAMDVLNTLIDTGLGTILDIITLVFALIAGDNEKAGELIYSINFRLMKNLGMLIENGMNTALEFIETSLNNLLKFATKIANSLIDVVEGALNAAVRWVNDFINTWNELAMLTGLPTIGFSFKEVKLPDLTAPEIELPRVTMISDRISELEEQYEKLLADRAVTGDTVTDNSVTNNITQNIYAGTLDTAKTVGDKAGTQVVRYANGGGGRG